MINYLGLTVQESGWARDQKGKSYLVFPCVLLILQLSFFELKQKWLVIIIDYTMAIRPLQQFIYRSFNSLFLLSLIQNGT